MEEIPEFQLEPESKVEITDSRTDPQFQKPQVQSRHINVKKLPEKVNKIISIKDK